MKPDIGDLLTSTIVTLLIAMPIIVDEVSKEIKKFRKTESKSKNRKLANTHVG